MWTMCLKSCGGSLQPFGTGFRPRSAPSTGTRETRAVHIGQGAKENGFTLVAALFLILVLALLALIIATVGGVQRQSVNLALLQTRGYYAAQSGIEWGTWQALYGSGANPCNGSPGAVNGFTVTVTCTSTVHRESGENVTVYALAATATYGAYGQADFVSRSIQTTVIAP